MPGGGDVFLWPFLLVALLYLADAIRTGLVLRNQAKRLDTLTRIVASRNYVEYARAERILAQGEKPKSFVGDGYTEALE